VYVYTHLKDRQYYEDLYDEGTVEQCRSGERMVNATFRKMEQEHAKEIASRKPGWYLQYSTLYFSLVEMPAAARHMNRDEAIDKWMQRDEAKDRKLAEAHIAGGTFCRSCGKDMHVIDKHYMRREGHKKDDILLMFECDACNKRKAFWQDGTEWEGAQLKCEKCGGEVKSTHKTKDKVLTTTLTCTKCGHKETEVMDMSKDPKPEEEFADPYYELDRKRFVFGSDMMFKFEQKAQHLARLQKLHATAVDHVGQVDIYDAIKDIKKLKIAQLSELLAPVLTKQKYTEFKLGELQLGWEVSLDFNCLDADADREEYRSRKGLQKLLDKILVDTNWRLMSDGVSYRLGFLSGRLRAYESEEDLKKLVEQRIKSGKLQPKPTQPAEPVKEPELDIRESALVYMDKMMLGSKPAEITLKSGKKKKTGVSYISAEMNPLLRVIIPMRDNDESVPEFIRTFDFKMSGEDDIPKVHKDSLGREIRLL